MAATTWTDALAEKRLAVEFTGEETEVRITTAAGDVITVTPERNAHRIHSVVRVNGVMMGSTSLQVPGRHR